MKFVKDILPVGHRNRPGHPMKPKGLLYHTTNNWNKGAGDEMHAEYMENTNRVVSWHETVDKDSCTQHLPHNENGWHAGDGGNGYYNLNWLGMEISCEAVDRGQPLDKATYNNAVLRGAQICKEYGFGWGDLQPHKIVYGKDCPHHTLFDHNQFKRDVFAKVEELTNKPAPKPKTVPSQPGVATAHIVKSGDTLSEIAAKYGTTVNNLVEINNLKNKNIIHVGQTIKLPVYLHTVEKGDTLTEIAEMYGTSVDYLVRLNHLDNPNKIYVGQRLKLQGTPVIKETPKAVAKPASKKKRIYLPPTAEEWRVYKLEDAPVKANTYRMIKPAKFGGLNYEILGTKEPHTYIIQTSNFGKVKIYGHPTTGAVIK